MAETCADILVIAGPTATGKTEVGIDLARLVNGEIISADARQIYRYMDIGTAKPSIEEQKRAVHHLIDVVDPDEPYSAGSFAKEAKNSIENILQRSAIPILVGGSGLYLQALLDGLAPIPPIPPNVRRRIQEESLQNPEDLYQRLIQVDPSWAKRVHPNDRQRIVRGIEVFEVTGRRLTDLQEQPRVAMGNWQIHWFGLRMKRQSLYERIDRRVDRMAEAGLIEEVIGLREKGYGPDLVALNTFGYREIFEYLEGKLALNSALDSIRQGTRNYAKRQLTWFGRNSRIHWVNTHESNLAEQILKQFDMP